MLIVGLTGASGSGKGFLCSLLCDDMIYIIDTDKVYHEMIDGPSPCTDALVSEFGNTVLNSMGGINRKALGAIVFSNKDALNTLNTITHRYILEKCRSIIDSCGKKIVIVDAPVLFESGFNRECDVTVAVVAAREVRIERIIKRDGIDRESACRRIDSQRTDDWFRENCDMVIENNGEDIYKEALKLKTVLMRLYEQKEEKEEG